jgi:hypothetical protein
VRNATARTSGIVKYQMASTLGAVRNNHRSLGLSTRSASGASSMRVGASAFPT